MIDVVADMASGVPVSASHCRRASAMASNSSDRRRHGPTRVDVPSEDRSSETDVGRQKLGNPSSLRRVAGSGGRSVSGRGSRLSFTIQGTSVRLVTAASLFDGHDAAINVMRRILQSQGAEVVHLGHNRSVDEVVRAAVQEDVQGVAVSLYQGGHIEYFTYLVDRLRAEGRPGHQGVRRWGRGHRRRRDLPAPRHGVARIFSPADGQRLGLARMVNTIIEACDIDLAADAPASADDLLAGDPALARTVTAIQGGPSATPCSASSASRRPPLRSRAGRDRHRRLGQVVADRRAGPAPPPRLRRQAPHRRRGRRPHSAAGPAARCSATASA